MHRSDHSRFQQAHDFVPDFSKAEPRTRIVIGVTAVILGCAFLLKDGRNPEDHTRASAHHHDLNLRAAYLHVLADAFTSVLAIVALTGGKFFGLAWLDPVVGLVGSGVVFSWAYTLL